MARRPNPAAGRSCCTPAPTTRGGSGGPPVVNRCCGRDLGPLEDHEDPCEADIERFDRDTVVCPACKEEVYDEASVCHACGHALMGRESEGVPKWALATAGVVIGGLLLLIFL